MWQRGTCGTILVLFLSLSSIADDALRERLKDTNAEHADVWVYNDIQKAMDDAKRQRKPLFVTFRCVPCKNCAAFDADVANGNERVRAMAKDKFVSVRQVEMKNVDLSMFQFDHDLNWAAMFINADGVVYARYGTQSSEGADAYNSIDGLLHTMDRVLEMHARYPDNLGELQGKRGDPKRVSNALEMPGLRNPAKYAAQTTRQNCVHCHNIHDAEHQLAVDQGNYSHEMLWKYPLPDNIGLKIDRKSGVRIESVTARSAAERAGIRAGEEIVRMNGQRIASIADIQWVLHHLPFAAAQVEVETVGQGKRTVELENGWKRYDFSWRASMWNAAPRLQVWTEPLSEAAHARLGLPESDTALEARWINRESPGGKRSFDDGLREKDVIVGIGGKPIHGTAPQFHANLKLNYKIGDILPLTVLRDGRREELKIHLVE